MEAFLADLEEGIFERPYFIFEDNYERELRKRVYDMCKVSEVIYEYIKTEEQAIKMRTEYRTLETGVFFIKKEFGRGLDAKLKKDAFVCIYEAGGDLDFVNRVQTQFTESIVLQMMGRSSRSQSQGQGCFYMIGDPTGGVDGWHTIKARSVTRNDDGGKVLKMIFDILKKVDVNDFLSNSSTVEAFSECNWQMNPLDFQKKHNLTYKAISE